jgi:predicted DNA-binding protein
MSSRVSSESAQKQMRRFSVSVPSEQYDDLLALARKNRVSRAWVVREAIERLLSDDMPLFHLRRPQ